MIQGLVIYITNALPKNHVVGVNYIQYKYDMLEDAKIRVRTGHGIPGKSWKIKILKSWPGKPGKLLSVMESHGKLDFLISE